MYENSTNIPFIERTMHFLLYPQLNVFSKMSLATVYFTTSVYIVSSRSNDFFIRIKHYGHYTLPSCYSLHDKRFFTFSTVSLSTYDFESILPAANQRYSINELVSFYSFYRL